MSRSSFGIWWLSFLPACGGRAALRIQDTELRPTLYVSAASGSSSSIHGQVPEVSSRDSLPGTGTAYTRPRVAYQVHMYHDMVKYGGPSIGCTRGALLAWQNEYDWYWFHLDTVENKIRELIHTRPRSTDSSATRP